MRLERAAVNTTSGRGQEIVDLYVLSPTRLHGVVLS
jgi:hypothetical protein